MDLVTSEQQLVTNGPKLHMSIVNRQPSVETIQKRPCPPPTDFVSKCPTAEPWLTRGWREAGLDCEHRHVAYLMNELNPVVLSHHMWGFLSRPRNIGLRPPLGTPTVS